MVTVPFYYLVVLWIVGATAGASGTALVCFKIYQRELEHLFDEIAEEEEKALATFRRELRRSHDGLTKEDKNG